VVAVVAVLWGGMGYLATRPADFHDYRTMTVSAAQEAYAAMATARLTASARADNRVTRQYAEAILDDSRKALAGAERDFARQGPPDDGSEQLRDELDPLLDKAEQALDRLDDADDQEELRAAADDATAVADGLNNYIAMHG
jgi:hypothetical protein